MEKQIKFAIIGCGRISVNHIDAITKAPHAVLTACCDLIEEKAQQVAEQTGCRWYTDIDTMLDNETVDVCCILTPSGMHCEHVCKVAERKINALCEKPLEVTEEKMLKMIRCCHENNVKLGCIFQRRTFEAAIKTKEAIEKGYLGRITLADAYLKYYRDQAYYDSGEWRATWELDGGGALMNQGVHGIDMINWMMGGIKSVNADCQRLAWDIEVEDTAVIRVKYNNGAIGVIEGATTAYPGLDTIFSIHGTKGSVQFGDEGFYYWKLEDKSIPMPDVSGSMGGKNCQYSTTNYGHTYQVEDMAMAILEDRDPMITGEDAMKSVMIILSIYKSSKEQKEINL